MDDLQRKILTTNALEKADKALRSSRSSICNSEFETALNRNYYAIFYAVMALAFHNEFATSKHLQLMGWFNKNFIHEQKLFDHRLLRIYKAAFENRQEADYVFDLDSTISYENVELGLKDAEFFVEKIREYLCSA